MEIADLIPAFVAAFAIQQLVELTDAIAKAVRGKSLPSRPKTAVYRLLSVIIGTVVAYTIDLKLLPRSDDDSLLVRSSIAILTGLFIGAGTDGFNSLLKLFEYKKDSAHSETHVADVLMKHSSGK